MNYSVEHVRSFDSFIEFVGQYARHNPYQRKGQALFNALDQVRPELARQLNERYEIDPFYNDAFYMRAVDWIRFRW